MIDIQYAKMNDVLGDVWKNQILSNIDKKSIFNNIENEEMLESVHLDHQIFIPDLNSGFDIEIDLMPSDYDFSEDNSYKDTTDTPKTIVKPTLKNYNNFINYQLKNISSFSYESLRNNNDLRNRFKDDVKNHYEIKYQPINKNFQKKNTPNDFKKRPSTHQRPLSQIKPLPKNRPNRYYFLNPPSEPNVKVYRFNIRRPIHPNHRNKQEFVTRNRKHPSNLPSDRQSLPLMQESPSSVATGNFSFPILVMSQDVMLTLTLVGIIGLYLLFIFLFSFASG